MNLIGYKSFPPDIREILLTRKQDPFSSYFFTVLDKPGTLSLKQASEKIGFCFQASRISLLKQESWLDAVLRNLIGCTQSRSNYM